MSLFVGFFAAVSYHTPYSTPWIYVCVAIYAYDFLVRMVRYRIKDAVLVPLDDTLTMIQIADCDAGFSPTQHVFLRVLKGSGAFESHPFTITNAPSSSSAGRGITLYAKVSGDWTRKIHHLAKDEVAETDDPERIALMATELDEKHAQLSKWFQWSPTESKSGTRPSRDHPGRKVLVTLDGPYGGLKLDVGAYQSALLVAGGSGVTFLLGSIEECLRVSGPRTVEAVWVVRDLSESLRWLAA